MMTYTVRHPRVKLIMPPSDIREKSRWDSYKERVMGAWPGEPAEPIKSDMKKGA